MIGNLGNLEKEEEKQEEERRKEEKLQNFFSVQQKIEFQEKNNKVDAKQKTQKKVVKISLNA